MKFPVKHELVEDRDRSRDALPRVPVSVIDLSTSDSDDSDGTGVAAAATAYVLEREAEGARVSDGVDGVGSYSKMSLDELGLVFPVGFLNHLPPSAPEPSPSPPALLQLPAPESSAGKKSPEGTVGVVAKSSKQFWKAGDYEGCPNGDWDIASGGMDHVRVHPKFLHSNATSHKWALGAFAELLDNSLDEVCNGATYVNVDMHDNKKDGSKMLIIEDNGGGMNPERMRQCMSLGYSAKSKIVNTIGQYGNGFKTSTMRLGADVIVFSRCRGNDGKSPSQSIGLLSYTFLRSTGKEDIVVPMASTKLSLAYHDGPDFKSILGSMLGSTNLFVSDRQGREWTKLLRYSGDWNRNVDTIVQWSPFSSEMDLLRQFNLMTDHGTRIIIYNLWEDDQGLLELDFDSDPHDIQLRGVNREEKNIQMAKQYPNSKHFLTYRHSLRNYASILYLRLPPSFRIILRGKDVEHHNIVNDMMMSQEKSYRPQSVTDGAEKELDMTATVTIGFVKDAKYHIDVQGFNVYHKNRLIKPFWRLWNAAGSDGRGVIGVLEANFVEPAHDKQGFERTTVLARLETKLIQMQKTYWSTLCHKIGYAPRHNRKYTNGATDRDSSPDYLSKGSSHLKRKSTASCIKMPVPGSEKFSSSPSNLKMGKDSDPQQLKTPSKSGKRPVTSNTSSPSIEDVSDDDSARPPKRANGSIHKTIPSRKSLRKEGLHISSPSSHLEDNESQRDWASGVRSNQPEPTSQFEGNVSSTNGCSLSDADLHTIEQLKEENRELRQRLEKREGETMSQLLQDLQREKDRRKSLEGQVEEAQRKIDNLNREQESLIDIFSEERERRDMEEENLRKKLKDASNTIQQLLNKVQRLEQTKPPNLRQTY